MLSKIQQEMPFKIMDLMYNVPDNQKNHLRIVNALSAVCVIDHQIVTPIEVIVSANSSSNKARLTAEPSLLQAFVSGTIALCARVLSSASITQNTRRSDNSLPSQENYSIPKVTQVATQEGYHDLKPDAPILLYLQPCW